MSIGDSMIRLGWMVAGVLVLQGCGLPGKVFSDREVKQLREVVRTAALCQVAEVLQSRMERRRLYERDGRLCVEADLRFDSDRPFYGDAACTREVPFNATRFADYCVEQAVAKDLGNGALLDPLRDGWTLHPGNRFNVSAKSIKENRQPYMRRTVYKRVEAADRLDSGPDADGEVTPLRVRRGSGLCELEMRVYKGDPEASGLRPLLALHGGNWKFRKFGFFGLDAQISHYTERGFVVFAPFYRMTGEGEANVECRRATWREVTADVEDALRWVEAHGAAYGAEAGPVTLMGQSAGGWLAGWLALERPEAVARALLIYPPTDIGAYLRDIREGRVTEELALTSFRDFLGVEEVTAVDPEGAEGKRLSLPGRVAGAPARLPPLYLIHGTADQVVPVNQSTRLCNAMAGAPLDAPLTPESEEGRRASVACGEGGRLELIDGADHILDLCAGRLGCPSGGKEGRAAVAAALDDALEWLGR